MLAVVIGETLVWDETIAGFACGTGTEAVCVGSAAVGVAAIAVGCTEIGVAAGRISGAFGVSADVGESDGGSRVTFSPRARAALQAETSFASVMP